MMMKSCPVVRRSMTSMSVHPVTCWQLKRSYAMGNFTGLPRGGRGIRRFFLHRIIGIFLNSMFAKIYGPSSAPVLIRS